jgi:hypothetical protein
MRLKAVGFADAIDSPLFSEQDRVTYKALLRDLGPSLQLNLAIALADMGFNPLVRSWLRVQMRIKDFAKVILRAFRSAQPAAS